MRPSRLPTLIAATALGLTFATRSPVTAQGQTWCTNPFEPCDPDDSSSDCYLPPPPDARCEPVECEYCQKSPCYVGTGVYTDSAVDLQIPTSGYHLLVGRRYQSTQYSEGALGPGWSSSLIGRVVKAVYLLGPGSEAVEEATVLLPGGSRYRFARAANGTYSPPPGRRDQLVQNADGSFDLYLQQSLTVFHFSAQGLLLSIVDGSGNALAFDYSPSGQLQLVSDQSGSFRSLAIAWGADGRMASIEDSSGRTISYEYDLDGNLIGVENPLGESESYEYASGRFGSLLAGHRDRWDRVLTAVAYDSADRVSSYTFEGEVYTYTYRYLGEDNKTAKIDSFGNLWVYTFGPGGLVTDTVGPDGVTATHTEFNADGALAAHTDEVGLISRYSYDASGRVISETIDDGGADEVEFLVTYDPDLPMAVTAVDAVYAGTQTRHPHWQGMRYEYFHEGDLAPGSLRKVKRVLSDGVATETIAEYTYDTQGRLIAETDNSGAVVNYIFNSSGEVEEVNLPPNNTSGLRPTVRYEYDELGRLVEIEDPLGGTTTATYDDLDRVVELTLPSPNAQFPQEIVSTVSYDLFDPVSEETTTEVSLPNGGTTRTSTDQFGRVVAMVDEAGAKESYVYQNGRLATYADPNNNQTAYFYDAFRRLNRVLHPDGSEEHFTYHRNGLPKTRVDRMLRVFSYAYDPFDRLSRVVYPNLTELVFTYEGQKLVSVFDGNALPPETHERSYDNRFRVAEELQGARGALSFQYGPGDRLLQVSVEDGPTTEYEYFPDGSLKTVNRVGIGGPFAYAYDLAGRPTSVSFPNGQLRQVGYDGLGRVLSVSNTHPTAGTLASFSYEYDVDQAGGTFTQIGELTARTETIPLLGLNSSRTEYSFDPVGQLLVASYPSIPGGAPASVHSWTYDPLGNRLTGTVDGVSELYNYQHIGSNPLAWQRLVGKGTDTFEHDLNGNTLEHQSASGTRAFSWDSQNRLIATSGPSASTFKYDYAHRRTASTLAGAETRYLYMGSSLVASSGGVEEEYVYGPGVDDILAIRRDGETYFYSTDALGSVAAVSTSSGTVVGAYTYDAWGKTRQEYLAPGSTNPLGFTARETSFDSTYFSRRRWLDTNLGRFLSEDPKGRDPDASFYRYARNSPLLFSDPFGLRCFPTVHKSPWHFKMGLETGMTPWSLYTSSADPSEPGFPPNTWAEWQYSRGSSKARARHAPGPSRHGAGGLGLVVFWGLELATPSTCTWISYPYSKSLVERKITIRLICKCPADSKTIETFEQAISMSLGKGITVTTPGSLLGLKCSRPDADDPQPGPGLE